MASKINRRESAALINALSGGVVPRIGLRHIAVGREAEVKAFLQNLTTIEEGGAAFRLVCGRYGSGKSFLLQMIRSYALEQQFVAVDADLSPERRLVGTKEEGIATYRELMQHLSINSRPEGGALESILQRWITGIQNQVIKEENLKVNDEGLIDAVSIRISEVLAELSEMAYGFAFSSVIDAYWRGVKTSDDSLKQAALRWIRGEYVTKQQAKRDLPVDRIIDSQTWYEFLKLFALFVHKAGYKGLLVFLDEGVNLYKIPNKITREKNYEKILTIFNDTMQGMARYIGVIMSGTPEFVDDERRGLYSYGALRSRLAEHRFSGQGFIDYNSPVIRLNQLSPDEIYLLLERLCAVHGSHYSYDCTLGEKELTAFLESVNSRLGTDQLLTPREVTRDFLGLLDILYQNPETLLETLLAEEGSTTQTPASISPQNTNTQQGLQASESVFSDFDI